MADKKGSLIKWILLIVALVFFITTIFFLSLFIHEKNKDKEIKDLYSDIQITEEWDKTFKKVIKLIIKR